MVQYMLHLLMCSSIITQWPARHCRCTSVASDNKLQCGLQHRLQGILAWPLLLFARHSSTLWTQCWKSGGMLVLHQLTSQSVNNIV